MRLFNQTVTDHPIEPLRESHCQGADPVTVITRELSVVCQPCDDWTGDLSTVYPASRPKLAGIGSSQSPRDRALAPALQTLTDKRLQKVTWMNEWTNVRGPLFEAEWYAVIRLFRILAVIYAHYITVNSQSDCQISPFRFIIIIIQLWVAQWHKSPYKVDTHVTYIESIFWISVWLKTAATKWWW